MPTHYVHDLSPFLFEFGDGVGIRYYGLAYVLGFFWLYWVLGFFTRRGWLQWGRGNRDEFLFWVALLGVLVGGRLGYMLIYDWQRFSMDLLSVLRVWEGGMASHGGIVGVGLVIGIYSWRRGMNFLSLSDAVAWAAPLGLAMGRVANFINGELWGRPTDVSWAVIFPQAPIVDGHMVPRHPSQLYEAFFEGVLVFIVLWIIRFRWKAELKPGTICVAFLFLYGVARIGCECFREPDGGRFIWGMVTMGQALTVGLLLLLLLVLLAWKWKGALLKSRL
jgi:phosphatidylglycerol:prolipoprotein diacylglycerol transferase